MRMGSFKFNPTITPQDTKLLISDDGERPKSLTRSLKKSEEEKETFTYNRSKYK